MSATSSPIAFQTQHARRLAAWPGDFTGAFSDGAVLFPLLLALAAATGASAAVMLATSGVAYLAAGWVFRLPIPVQPFKSLAITAIAVGASAAELRTAGVLLGLIYLGLSFARLNSLAKHVPIVLVHGFQVGLGILLLVTAVRLLGPSSAELIGVLLGGVIIVLLTRLSGLPLLGVVAIGVLVYGLLHPTPASGQSQAEGIRATAIALMVLPQIALTLTNSVLGTQRAAIDYYGPRAWRVTPRRILLSLGLGNILAGALGGLPYCHGSGGVTAHYRGGSRTWRSNSIIGVSLILLSLLLILGGGGVPQYHPALQALLIGVIGWFHFRLALPSWRVREGRLVLMAMGSAALIFTNMMAVLIVGMILLTLIYFAGGRRQQSEIFSISAAATPDSSSKPL